METSDKDTDKCSSQFCHELPFQSEGMVTSYLSPCPYSSRALSQSPLPWARLLSLPSLPSALHTARVEKSLFLQLSPAWVLYLSQTIPWFLSRLCCVSPFTFVQLQQARVEAYLFLGFLVKIHLLDK